MATVSFHLKEPGADRPTAIYALLTIDRRHRVKVYTGQSIHPDRWNKADQRAQLRGKGNELNGHLNDALTGISERLLLAYAESLATGTLPTAAALREAAAPERPAEPDPVEAAGRGPQFWQRYEEWVNYTRAAGTVRTAQAHATAGRHLREFSDANGYAIDFDTLTPTVGDRWAAYLLNVAGLTDNTINKHLGRLKAFMKWAAKRGYTENTALDRVSWARREPDVIALSTAELAALENLPLPVGSRLDKARAWFLLACYTGLRYSDLVSIRPQHLRPATDKLPAHLRLTAQKTRAVVNVPLSARALDIVNRLLAGELATLKSQPITNPVLNRFLKELGPLAGIDSPVEVIRYRGGIADVTTCPKHEKLTVHTARRTFVTLNLGKGMSAEFVMKLTGHTSYKSFQRYVNLTPQRVAEEFAKFHEMPD
ncbi:tyrosine-type recombinase/integrase [Hymenobacter taeanensis]|uniref:Tyrosine-type recombinase/integrase n=1 Tax=Hymenobacter taeanensis TaxID=2735321 RepID=A0A6M6BH91_9BACT|nr:MULTISPECIES: site-specific integrase [Hymenobacter]QJX46623.1 tyrosine-type recombinase/integrase [Hymenobacter taeanensis]UOQ80486.1 site-specific integrase [Hymenobacter sp. 5414T-23]